MTLTNPKLFLLHIWSPDPFIYAWLTLFNMQTSNLDKFDKAFFLLFTILSVTLGVIKKGLI